MTQNKKVTPDQGGGRWALDKPGCWTGETRYSRPFGGDTVLPSFRIGFGSDSRSAPPPNTSPSNPKEDQPALCDAGVGGGGDNAVPGEGGGRRVAGSVGRRVGQSHADPAGRGSPEHTARI